MTKRLSSQAIINAVRNPRERYWPPGRWVRIPKNDLDDHSLSQIFQEAVWPTKPWNLLRMDFSKSLGAGDETIAALASAFGDERPEGCPELTALYLTGCTAIKDLAPLKSLTKLEALYLTGCEGIIDLSPLEKLSALKWLSIRGCAGVTVIAPLHHLSALESLDLSHCIGVTDLTPLDNLSSLRGLSLRGCTGVTDLTTLQTLTNLDWLELDGCGAVAGIPEELLVIHEPQRKLSAVFAFAREKKSPLHECRVFLVGEPYVGKSSLFLALQEHTVPKHLERTEGIEIKRGSFDWEVEGLGRIAWSVWDLGGHYWLHAAHRAFFTGTCAYLLLMDPERIADGDSYRAESSPHEQPDAGNRLAYWRGLISRWGRSSPVITVRTRSTTKRKDRLGDARFGDWKTDEPKVNVLIDIPIDVDCPPPSESGEPRQPVGLDDLKRALAESLKNSELRQHVTQEFPVSWKNARNYLRELFDRDRIPRIRREEFLGRICDELGVTEIRKDREVLLSVLDALGDVIHYGGSAQLEDWVFDIDQVKDAIYAVTKRIMLSQRADASFAAVGGWTKESKCGIDAGVLLQIMQERGLAYQIPFSESEIWRFPAFLNPCPTDRPERWVQGICHRVRVGPWAESDVQKAAVRLHNNLNHPKSFRDAAVFRHNDSDAYALWVESEDVVLSVLDERADRDRILGGAIMHGIRGVDGGEFQWGEAERARPGRARPRKGDRRAGDIRALEKELEEHLRGEWDKLKGCEKSNRTFTLVELTQKELAARTGVSEPTVTRCIRDKSAHRLVALKKVNDEESLRKCQKMDFFANRRT